MRYYEIYSINSDVANDYFGKDEKLFQLFIEMKTNTDKKLQLLLNRQIDFITDQISSLEVHQYIRRHMLKSSSKSEQKKWLGNRISDNNGFVNFSCYPNRIFLEVSGNIEQETWVFEALRSMENHFLAIDCQDYCIGWLKPVKVVSFIRRA